MPVRVKHGKYQKKKWKPVKFLRHASDNWLRWIWAALKLGPRTRKRYWGLSFPEWCQYVWREIERRGLTREITGFEPDPPEAKGTQFRAWEQELCPACRGLIRQTKEGYRCENGHRLAFKRPSGPQLPQPQSVQGGKPEDAPSEGLAL